MKSTLSDIFSSINPFWEVDVLFDLDIKNIGPTPVKLKKFQGLITYRAMDKYAGVEIQLHIGWVLRLRQLNIH
jgi:hypothetical protein